MSLHEKSAWACLASTLLIWGAYFVLVFTLPVEQSGIAVPAVIAAIVLQTIVMIAASISFAILHRESSLYDERDRLIALRSGHCAGWVLSVGVFCCVVLFPMREAALHMDPPGALATGALASPFATGNILLALFVFSEVVHYGAQILLYRRS
jgi:hypothetical protein